MHIVHVGGASRAGVRNCVLLISGSPKNTMVTWRVSLMPGLWRLSNLCFLLLTSFLFSYCSLGFYGGLTSSPFFSELPAVSCIQHSYLHLTPPNMYVVKVQLHCLPCPPRSIISCNTRISDAWVPEQVHKLTFWTWPQLKFLSVTACNLAFLSVTDTYVCAYICTSRE